jgi:uncharacterized membrane protein HdeD (DUF308 family)
MLVGLMLIVCALVLLAGLLYLVPAFGRQLEKLAKFLGGFQALIGVIAIIVAILNIDSLAGVILLIVGLILAASVMSALPAVGKYIAKLTKALGAFQTVIGVIALIVGIWDLLRECRRARNPATGLFPMEVNHRGQVNRSTDG